MKIMIDGIEVTVIEHDMVQSINKNLRRYVEEVLALEYDEYMPRDGDQNFSDLNNFCGDLISKIGKTVSIILEVKLKNGTQLPAYDDDQHRGLIALAKQRVPVHYCYNGFNFKVNRPTTTDVSSFLACEPSKLGGMAPASDQHEALDVVVSRLVGNDKGGFDETVYSFAVSEICGDPTYQLSQMTAKCLLMLYNPDLGKICLLNQAAAKTLVRNLRVQCYAAQNKGTTEFIEKLNEFSESIRQTLQSLEPRDLTPSDDDDDGSKPSALIF